ISLKGSAAVEAMTPQRGLDPLDHLGHGLLQLHRGLGSERLVRRAPDRVAALLERAQVVGEAFARGTVELGEGGFKGYPRLKSRLARAARVEVALRAQHELLADERLLAPAEQRGEALVGRERVRPAANPRARGGWRKLRRRVEAPVRHLVAGALPDADHRRTRGDDVAYVGVGRRGPVRAQQGIQLARSRAHLLL